MDTQQIETILGLAIQTELGGCELKEEIIKCLLGNPHYRAFGN